MSRSIWRSLNSSSQDDVPHRILNTIGDTFAQSARSILESIGETEYATLTQEKLVVKVPAVSILIVGLGLRVDKQVIDAGKCLTIIATPTTGIDHIDSAYARKKGITVLSLQGETAFLKRITATAELALGLLLALVRKIPAAHTSVLRNEWNRSAFCGHSLAGKTLGIVGFGRLGSMMGKYGKALGMNVIFTDPKKKGGVPLTRLLKTADVISIHVPLTEKTERMIGAKEMKCLKPSALLINTARGNIVDEGAILAALKSYHLTGYAADVLADELSFTPTKARSALIDFARTHDNVIITPHIGGTTVEARRATDMFIAEKLQRVSRYRCARLSRPYRLHSSR